jgi:hypothetical protein
MAMRMYPPAIPASPAHIEFGVTGTRQTSGGIRTVLYSGGRRDITTTDPRTQLEERLRAEARRLFPNSVQSQEWYVRQQLQRMQAAGTLPPPTPGPGPDPLGQYLTEQQNSFDEARRANEQRYQDILTGLESSGAQERADIRARYAAIRSGGLGDLASRGLAGTSLASGVRTLAARGESESIGRLEDRLRMQRLGFMERRTDTYPDEATMLDLAQGAGRYGVGRGLPGTTAPVAPGAPVAGAAPVPGLETTGAGTVICPTCGGTGRLDGRLCPTCGGSGRIPAGVATSAAVPGSREPYRPLGPLGPIRPQDQSPVRPRIQLYGGVVPMPRR